jgi:hypothetical protein
MWMMTVGGGFDAGFCLAASDTAVTQLGWAGSYRLPDMMGGLHGITLAA